MPKDCTELYSKEQTCAGTMKENVEQDTRYILSEVSQCTGADTCEPGAECFGTGLGR